MATEFLPSTHRTIGARTFIVTALPTAPGRRLFFKLVKICGPAITRFLRSLDGKSASLEELDVSVLAGAADELIKNLDEVTFEDFYKTFSDSTRVVTPEGGEAPLATYNGFSADYGSMVKWMAFCLEVNYASFFGDLGLTALRASAPAVSQSQSPTK